MLSRISNSKTYLFNKLEKIQIYSYKNKLGNNINFAITKGRLRPNKSTPVRVLSTKIKVFTFTNKRNKYNILLN